MSDFPVVLTEPVDNVTDVLAKHIANIEAKIGIDDSAVATSIDFKLGKKPTELKVSSASKGGVFNGKFELGTPDTAVTADGWIVNQKYGWYFDEVATEASAEFDTFSPRKGKQSLLIQAIDATGTAIVYNTEGVTLPILAMQAVPLKVSTSYRLSAWVRTDAGVGASGAFIDITQYDSAAVVGTTSVSNKLSASQNWQLVSVVFTTDNDAVYGRIGIHNDVAGAVSNAWFDDVKLEEIVTDTTFTGKVPEKIRPVLQAVTSTDNVDQSLDSGGAYSNVYTLTSAVNEGATHRQTFTPTKKYISEIGVFIVEAGTGVNWSLDIHRADNTPVGMRQIAAASIVEGAWNYFDCRGIWDTGALHFHVYASATTGTPTIKANTTDDLETGSFIQRYAKKTETMKVVCNGVVTELKSDKDGILGNSVLDLDNGKYLYGGLLTTWATEVVFANDVYSASGGGGNTTNRLINDYSISSIIYSAIDTVARTMVLKVNVLLPVKHLKFRIGLGRDVAYSFDVSSDNVNYTPISYGTTDDSSKEAETDLMNGLSTFYIRFNKTTANNYFVIKELIIYADVDTSRIPSGLLYPLAVNQFTETVKLPQVATRVYFRSAKFTNEYGVIVPALEFTNATPYTIGYIPLKLDNSQETSPCVSLLSTTTNYQQSGTGSAVTGGYVLNDGEYMTLTTTVAELKVDYQVGTGTTAIAAITKNTLFLSANGEGDDSTQDPSHQMNAIVGVRQQGLIQRIDDLGEEIAKVREGSVETPAWADWTPTLTWTTATPITNVVTKARYRIIDGVCHFNFYYKADDGSGATVLTISLPTVPKDNDSFISLSSQEKVNTTWSNPLAYIDDSASLIAFRNFSTCTDDVAVVVQVSGSYECFPFTI